MTRLVIADYGMGNLRSVQKALEHVGAEAKITSDHGEIRRAQGIVLPGVGAFAKAMTEMRLRELDAVLTERIAVGVPTLGICLGMQLLFEASVEGSGGVGLGVFKGRVEAVGGKQKKLPHIGWNEVNWQRRSSLTDGLPNPCPFYHVHSYAPVPATPQAVLGTCSYGTDFTTAVSSGSVYGLQFHPEKSAEHGLRLLSNFAALCGLGATPVQKASA